MIGMQEFYHFKVTIVLHSALYGVRYHREVDMRLTHPT